MSDFFLKTRGEMIEDQLKRRGISDKRVLKAMAKVPREKFVSKKLQSLAYEDRPLPIEKGQTISQPFIVALSCQLLELKGRERVLDIGTGSGYQAAVLGLLAKEVISLEIDKDLAFKAKKRLAKLGFGNIKVVNKDGRYGFESMVPYDAIVCAAAIDKVPQAWEKQLREGGRIVLPEKRKIGQELVRITKRKGKFEKEDFGGVAFVPFRE